MVLARVEELLSSGSFFRISRSALINLNFLTRVSRKNRTCTLEFNSRKLDFHIPARNIRMLEEKLDKS
jgi:DNA-binding LytR/AlgR family response regulator